ncbi:MAG: hypothetical protein EXQ56_05110 [Acidobacteria bacterium]|nr:hypothetical protein [Acidobacteriota bacterium]
MQLLILTGQRLNEAAHMKWGQVDAAARMWTLPKEATKAKRIHDVPLSAAAMKLLTGLPRFTAGDYVFTTRSGLMPINGFSKIDLPGDFDTSRSERESHEGGI